MCSATWAGQMSWSSQRCGFERLSELSVAVYTLPGMKQPFLIVVEGYVPTAESDLDNLREQVLSFALDQRAFGPRKLLTAFADADGRFRGLVYAERTDPPLIALRASLDYLGIDAVAAVVFCDEPVTDQPVTPAFLQRFEEARAAAAEYGVHLVDWFGCDDELFWAARLRTYRVEEQPDWWDVPPRAPRSTRLAG